MSKTIKTRNLTRHFETYEKEEGLLGSLKGLFKREYKTVKAVDGVDLQVNNGELVGLIGLNGAGKTTTLKMLSGLLNPTRGETEVLGFTPYKRKGFGRAFRDA